MASIAVLFVVPWLDTSKVRSANYRPWYRIFFWLFVADCILLGWLGSKPAEGIYVIMSQLGMLYYFAFFIVIMPLTFVSNAFVDPVNLPGPLETFANWNPVSAVAQAARVAFGNTGGVVHTEPWSMANPFAYSLIWIGIILAVFIPLSIRQYMKAASR